MAQPIDAVVFDLGGVLIDWNPRHLYRTMFDGDEAAMEQFLAEVCTPEWNVQQDAGRPWAEAVETLARTHPDQADLIAAYDARWDEMLGGAIEGTLEILAELRRRGVRLFVLSNWSREKFPPAQVRYPFLEWFDGIVISGDTRVAKPDVRIFRVLLERFDLAPAATVFIDDSAPNVAAARKLGLVAVRFEDPAQLRNELAGLGLLDPAG